MDEFHHKTSLPEEIDMSRSDGLIEITLDRMSEATRHLDHQTHIVIGISTAVFVFTASIFEKDHGSVALFFVMIFSAASSLMGLLAVHPPRSMRKRGQSESLLYRKVIQKFKSAKEYEKAINEVMASPEKIRREYAIEIYNVCKYYYRPKRKLFHISRKLLFYGIAFSLGTFLLEVAMAL